MNYLIITNGIIENIIVSDETFANSVGAFPYYNGAEMGGDYSPPPTEPIISIQDEMDALLVDMAYNIALLELGVM